MSPDGAHHHDAVDERRQDQQIAHDERHGRDPPRPLQDRIAVTGARALGLAGEDARTGQHRPQGRDHAADCGLVLLEPPPPVADELGQVRTRQRDHAHHGQQERRQQLHAAHAAPPFARLLGHAPACEAQVGGDTQEEAEDPEREDQQCAPPRHGGVAHELDEGPGCEQPRRRPHYAGGEARQDEDDANPEGARDGPRVGRVRAMAAVHEADAQPHQPGGRVRRWRPRR